MGRTIFKKIYMFCFVFFFGFEKKIIIRNDNIVRGGKRMFSLFRDQHGGRLEPELSLDMTSAPIIIIIIIP